MKKFILGLILLVLNSNFTLAETNKVKNALSRLYKAQDQIILAISELEGEGEPFDLNLSMTVGKVRNSSVQLQSLKKKCETGVLPDLYYHSNSTITELLEQKIADRFGELGNCYRNFIECKEQKNSRVFKFKTWEANGDTYAQCNASVRFIGLGLKD